MVENNVTILREQSAAMKGLLICLVVLGHNVFFVDVFPAGSWNWLYCFHVSSFFILPFFYLDHEFTWQRVWTNTKRLLWPYFYMFVLLFLINNYIFKSAKFDVGLINTLVTGNEYMLKKYTGFQYLWFLPTMFSMLVIKDIYTSCNKTIKRILLSTGGVFYIVLWIFFTRAPYNIEINRTIASLSIASIFLGSSMFFIGYVTHFVVNKWAIPRWFSLSVLILSFIIILMNSDTSLEPLTKWFSRAICPIAGFCFLFKWKCYNCFIMRRIGSLSLPIFLFHQPLNFFFCSSLKNINCSSVMLLVVSFAIVMVLSYLLANVVIRNNYLNKLLLPK